MKGANANSRRAVTLAALGTSAAAWIAFTALQGASLGQMSMAYSSQWTPSAGYVTAMMWLWLLMTLGMMLPSVLAPIWHICDRSFPHRKLRGAAIFGVAYIMPWMALGIAFIPIMTYHLSIWPLFAIAIAAALVWQFSPVKQHCLNRCHSLPPLRAFGWTADFDVIRFGLGHGLACVAACWALMLVAMTLPTGRLVGMSVVALWIFGEKLERPEEPCWRLRAPKKIGRVIAFKLRPIAPATHAHLS